MGLVGFPGGSDGKESACDAGDPGLIPSQGRCPREGNGREDSIFLPGEFHGQRSLVGYSPQDRKGLDTTEQLTLMSIFKCRSQFIAFFPDHLPNFSFHTHISEIRLPISFGFE